MRRVDAQELEVAFAVVMRSAGRPPAVRAERRLVPLFRELQSERPSRDPEELMEMIWAIWIHHPDESAAGSLAAANEAIAAGASDLARPILDRLVEQYPDWAEAWNKRATLAYLEKRDSDSIRDIARTLELEPRHFGALFGFAQICLRHRRIREAKAAFEMALSLNPHLPGLADIIADLASMRGPLH